MSCVVATVVVSRARVLRLGCGQRYLAEYEALETLERECILNGSLFNDVSGDGSSGKSTGGPGRGRSPQGSGTRLRHYIYGGIDGAIGGACFFRFLFCSYFVACFWFGFAAAGARARDATVAPPLCWTPRASGWRRTPCEWRIAVGG